MSAMLESDAAVEALTAGKIQIDGADFVVQGVEPVCTAAENEALDTSAAAGTILSVLATTFAAAALALL
jgi:hypothetical protein